MSQTQEIQWIKIYRITRNRVKYWNNQPSIVFIFHSPRLSSIKKLDHKTSFPLIPIQSETPFASSRLPYPWEHEILISPRSEKSLRSFQIDPTIPLANRRFRVIQIVFALLIRRLKETLDRVPIVYLVIRGAAWIR